MPYNCTNYLRKILPDYNTIIGMNTQDKMIMQDMLLYHYARYAAAINFQGTARSTQGVAKQSEIMFVNKISVSLEKLFE